MPRKASINEFIAKARNVHGDKYDYSKVNYINATTKVCIICPIHGEFYQTPSRHLLGGCKKCGVDTRVKKRTISRDDFIKEANIKHNYKYDYSKVEYINSKTKICIICPIHGEFWQTPNSHLNGRQCVRCGYESIKKQYFGFGYNDVYGIFNTKLGKQSYVIWHSMLERCYNKEMRYKWPTYSDCVICEEWKYLSNFKRWFDEHYIEGWHLDKDILVKGNRVYSPKTCCFVPQEINILFDKHTYKGDSGIQGVHTRENGISFQVVVARKYLGTFYDKEQAFKVYKVAKEKYIKEAADKWKDQLEPRVYEAMCNYQVEIND